MADKNLKGKAKRPIGSAGTSLASGYMQEEHIASLQGTQKSILYDEMRRTSDTVGTMERALKNPARQATYKVEPGLKGDKLSEEQAQFFNWLFFDGEVMQKSFTGYVTDFLTILNHGFYIGAPTIEAVEHPKLGWKWGLTDIDFRSQKTIERWNIDKKTGKLKSVYQNCTGTDFDFQGNIPVEDLEILSLDMEGKNWEGKSIYRNSIGLYKAIKLIDKISIAGFERSALGIPHIKMSRDYETNEIEKAALIAAVKGLQAHKTCYILTYDDINIDMLKIDFDAEKADKMIDKRSTRMLMTILADFLMLGHTNSGSWAMHNGKKSMFLMSLIYYINIYVSMLDRLMKRITIMNWGTMEYYPYFSVTGVKEESLKAEAEVAGLLVEKGIISKGQSLEDFFRQRANYPEMTEEEKEAKEAGKEAIKNMINKPAGDDDKTNKVDDDDKQTVTDDNKKDAGKEANTPEDKRQKMAEEKRFYRPLTKYEEKADFTKIDNDFTVSIVDWNTNVKNGLAKIIEKHTIDMRNALKSGGNPYKVVESIEISSGVKDFQREVLENIKGMVKTGKRQAAKELDKKKFADDVFGPGIYTWIGITAKNFTKGKVNDLDKLMTGAAINKLNTLQGKKIKDSDINFIVAASQTTALNYVNNENNLGGNLITEQAINGGRKDTYLQNDDVIGFQYSAILDDRTTEICQELDGRTREVDDFQSADSDPPNHFGCRSVLIPILASEGAPEWTGFLGVSSNAATVKQFKEACYAIV